MIFISIISELQVSIAFGFLLNVFSLRKDNYKLIFYFNFYFFPSL